MAWPWPSECVASFPRESRFVFAHIHSTINLYSHAQPVRVHACCEYLRQIYGYYYYIWALRDNVEQLVCSYAFIYVNGGITIGTVNVWNYGSATKRVQQSREPSVRFDQLLSFHS